MFALMQTLAPSYDLEPLRSSRLAGVCDFDREVIAINADLLDGNSLEELLDTTLHEIAHALAGPEHDHDIVWQKWAVKLGARPVAETPWRTDNASSAPYRLTCARCGWSLGSTTYQRNWFCRSCRTRVNVYDNASGVRLL